MKIAMLFPGYGSQYVGMGKELYDEYRIVQEYFEEASNCLSINFVKLCFASSEHDLSGMQQANTAIFLISSTIYALLKQEGIEPSLVAGYNLGEYGALFAAGSISLPDGLYLLSKLSSLYQDALREMDVRVMQVQGVDMQTLQLLSGPVAKAHGAVDIAFVDGAYEHSVSGERDAVDHLEKVLSSKTGITTADLPFAVGLHSSRATAVAANFKMYLEKVDFKQVRIPCMSCIDGRIILHSSDIKERILKHIVSPLYWSTVLFNMQEYDLFIEVGPGTVLTSMVRKAYPDKRFIAINKPSDIEKLKHMIPTITL